ncbi:hypothetical protein ACHAQA_006719 [Verticillium albo-atrum]
MTTSCCFSRCLFSILFLQLLATLATALPTISNSTTAITTSSPSATGTPLPSPVYLVVAPAATPDGPPDYDALFPADPATTPRATADLAEHGLRQTTYYSCATYATTTHCGWHRPLVPVAAASVGTPARGGTAVALAGSLISVLLAVVVLGV